MLDLLEGLALGWLSAEERPRFFRRKRRVAQPAPEAPVAPTPAPPPDSGVPFLPGEPQVWDDYKGQDRAKELLKLTLYTGSVNPHPRLMFIAPRGVGKTSLARIFAKAYRDFYLEVFADLPVDQRSGWTQLPGRYIEVTPAMISKKDQLDALMRQIENYTVLFIDEVHMLPREIADTLLPALESNRYPFPEGMKPLPAYFTWLAATTDVGLLPEAFLDRFQMMPLEPLTVRDLYAILQTQPIPVVDEAAWEIARRSAGYPRDLKRVYARARDVAVAEGADRIAMRHAVRGFDLLGLDEHGLYDEERRILQALFNNPRFYATRADGSRTFRYVSSEASIRTLTGLDPIHYKTLEGKLIRLGLLRVGPGGRELTNKALDIYFEGVRPSY